MYIVIYKDNKIKNIISSTSNTNKKIKENHKYFITKKTILEKLKEMCFKNKK